MSLTAEIVYNVLLQLAKDSNEQEFEADGHTVKGGGEYIEPLWYNPWPQEKAISLDGQIDCAQLARRLNEAMNGAANTVGDVHEAHPAKLE